MTDPHIGFRFASAGDAAGGFFLSFSLANCLLDL